MIDGERFALAVWAANAVLTSFFLGYLAARSVYRTKSREERKKARKQGKHRGSK